MISLEPDAAHAPGTPGAATVLDGTLQEAVLAGPDAALVHQVRGQAEAGELSTRQLRLVLLVVGDGDRHWRSLREAVLTGTVAERIPLAREILTLHTQLERWPALAFREVDVASTAAVFEACARIGLPGWEVQGPTRRGRSKREARERASLSLLAHLAGVADPLSRGTSALPLPRAGGRGGPGLGVEAFSALLQRRLQEAEPGPQLETELLGRAERAQLNATHQRLVLCAATGPGWTRVQQAVLADVARIRGAPAGLLARLADSGGGGPLRYTRDDFDAASGQHTVVAEWQAGGRLVTGGPQVARGRKTARHNAAASVLARLLGLEEPAPQVADEPDSPPRPVDLTSGKNPLQVINELKMREIITDPLWEVTGLPPRSKAGHAGFSCEASCRVDGEEVVTAHGRGKSKADARVQASAALLNKLQPRLQSALSAAGLRRQAPEGAALSAPSPDRVPASRRAVSARTGGEAPPAPAPRPAPAPAVSPVPGVRPAPAVETVAGMAAAAEAVAGGCAVTYRPGTGGGPGRMLLYRPEGASPGAHAAPPLRPARWDLAVDGPQHGVRAAALAGWELDEVLVAGRLLLSAPVEGMHPSAVAWRAVARRGLELIAAGGLVPGLGQDGCDRWLLRAPAGEVARMAAALPPQAHNVLLDRGALTVPAAADAVAGLWNDLADALGRSSGAAALFGDTAYAAAPRPAHVLQPWCDRVADALESGPPPELVLAVVLPGDEEGVWDGLLGVELLVRHRWDGPAVPAGAPGVDPGETARVRRMLRQAAEAWAPLARLAAAPVPNRLDLTLGEAAGLLDEDTVDELVARRLTVRWPKGLGRAITCGTVVGTHTTIDGRLGLDQLIDFRWQMAIDGVALDEEELNRLAEAARPLIRMRGRWMLVDQATAARARHTGLDGLSAPQALAAALTGTVTVDGHSYPCRAEGQLASTLDQLRTGQARTVPVPAGLKAELRDYQHRGLAWLASLTDLGFGAVLADDMGLGKTITAIALHLHRRPAADRPTLVVCPASLVTNWAREIARFSPTTPVIRYHGPGRTLDGLTPDTMVITTYQLLQRDAATLTGTGWDLVLADEAQHAKNPRTAAARRLRELPAATRVAITGTPVENGLGDLWALLDWTNPGLFGTPAGFRTRYARAAEKDTASAAARQLAALTAPFVLRRSKSDPAIAPELPDKLLHERIVQLTPEQTGLYEAAARETMAAIADASGIARRGLVVKLLTALRQICNHPDHYTKQPHPGPGGAARFAARSAKLTALDELMAAITARDEAALIFTSYVEMGELLTAHLTARGHDPLFLRGKTPTAQRTAMIDAFQSGRSRCFVLSIRAGGTGLNLTRASHVIHYDRPWNPAIEDQATDRAHRIGQRHTVNVHQLATENTVEDRIAALLAAKRALGQAVLTTGEAALGDLTDTELADLISLGSLS